MLLHPKSRWMRMAKSCAVTMLNRSNVNAKNSITRERYGKVLISGPATEEIRLWVTKKRLVEAQHFDDHSTRFNAANAIRAVSTGVYELKRVQLPLAMVRLEFCEDEDARRPPVLTLAPGFIVRA